MQVTWVQSLGWEDPLENGEATQSSILAWRIPWTWGPWGHKESDATEQFSLHFFTVPYNKCLSKTIIKNMQIVLIMLAFL